MTPTDFLDKRIATATRRYGAALDEAEILIKWQKERLGSGQVAEYFDPGNLSGPQELVKLNQELGALLALKDQIENQAREAISQ